jgi:hypothetical protein
LLIVVFEGRLLSGIVIVTRQCDLFSSLASKASPREYKSRGVRNSGLAIDVP